MTTGRNNQVVVARTVTPARRPQSSHDRPSSYPRRRHFIFFPFFHNLVRHRWSRGPTAISPTTGRSSYPARPAPRQRRTPTSRVTFLRRRHRGASTLRDVSPSSLLPTPTKAHRRRRPSYRHNVHHRPSRQTRTTCTGRRSSTLRSAMSRRPLGASKRKHERENQKPKVVHYLRFPDFLTIPSLIYTSFSLICRLQGKSKSGASHRKKLLGGPEEYPLLIYTSFSLICRLLSQVYSPGPSQIFRRKSTLGDQWGGAISRDTPPSYIHHFL